MKRLTITLAAVGFLLAIPASNALWGKGHVPLGKIQVCHKGMVLTVGADSREGHVEHGDFQLPACDFNNVFHTGESCEGIGDADGDGFPDSGLLPRDDAGGATPGCPAGTF